MIGLVVRSVVGDSLGMCGMIVGPLIAIAAICGIMQCCRCRLRDCGCCKRWLRMTGTDPFDDFEMMILVHKVSFTASSKIPCHVRIQAGDHEVCTDLETSGIFQQALSIFIEQGTEVLKFELRNSSDTVLAELQMKVAKEILHLDDAKNSGSPPSVSEKMFVMKQKNKNVLNPRVVLTFASESPGDEEQALLHGLNASNEVEWMLQQQLHKTQLQDAKTGDGQKPEQLSEIALLARGCFGPLHMFGTLGSKRMVYVGVLGPPRRKKFTLHVWDSEHDFREDKPAQQEVDLLRVSSVAPDPGRSEVFTVSHVNKDKLPQKAVFQRIDRSRDVWVELLMILVGKVHEEHNKKKDKKK
uniref:CERLI1-like PH domain-containing protein n=1 Tax=Alexandrium catenella TaxID=2925 RepID=A0A7S1SAX5_ALECA|mmetsp:Transcript_93658/g.248630  ORF Transcript_93658/g.248630 Transcript_93658/m.248630 type:complete len:355 (+) Transcript_93658:142-1206(+)